MIKRNVKTSICILLMSIFSSVAFAQDLAHKSEKESNYRVMISHPLEIYEGGSLEEALTLSKEWRDKVLLKNPKILSVDYLLEKQSATRHLLMVIYHYENKEEAKKANQLIGSLINDAWPDEEARKVFFQKLQSYVVQSEKKTFQFDVIN